nr:integrase, catalytic region, zinc finger, CCHC-type, peptidase aspartic, catalytic [Tanacetum cinerariifolium]
MSVRLADRSFQYIVGIVENMLVEVGKFIFPADFVILEIKEDSKMIMNSTVDVKHWTSRREDQQQHVINKFGIQQHSGHGHLDVLHVVDELGKPDIVVVNGYLLPECQRYTSPYLSVIGQNRLEVVLDLDEMGTFRETLAEGEECALHLGPERPRVYSDLSPKDKERYNADIRATNIPLQGLPKDIHTLINYYTDAKDIWDNVKMLLGGSKLTNDQESQLYNDFEHFRQNKGETIHDYYVRFTKLINDMRNIKMTMSRMLLNSKFVNNMLPEWGRFVIAVKLNICLRDSNYDQLNKAIVQDGRVVVHNVQGRQNRGQENNARGTCAAGNEGAQNRVGNVNSSQARQIKCYNCNDSEEFVNVFVRIGFGSTIKLVSFDESQVVTFNSKFVYGFRNSDCGTGSQSDNTVGNPHGFIIHWIEVLKGRKKVIEVIYVENWRIDNSRVPRYGVYGLGKGWEGLEHHKGKGIVCEMRKVPLKLIIASLTMIAKHDRTLYGCRHQVYGAALPGYGLLSRPSVWLLFALTNTNVFH